MKTFFTLLLLTNIAFALVQWLLPYEQLRSQPAPALAAEKLQLVNEQQNLFEETVAVSSTKLSDTMDAAPKPAELPTRFCYTLGPFKQPQEAQQVAAQFKKQGIDINSRPSQEQEYMGQMVFIDGHSSRADAIKTAEELVRKGVRDYIIVNDEDRSNILSLGVFSLKKNAEGRLNTIRKLGYPAQSEARYRNRTIYWLDYSESETGSLNQLIEELKLQKGISRISRQCA